MKNRYFFSIFGFCILLSIQVRSQNQFNIWYFGQGAGLDFNSGSAISISGGQLYTNEGSASICDDSTGRILFYTDGVIVYDSSHMAMSNGTGLSGDVTCTQSALIVKKPLSENLYYVFTVPADGGLTDLRYSIVDMNLNSGLGDVSLKNVFMATGITIAEKATAIHACNGIDWWIIFHELGSNNYKSWLLDSSGLSSSPVTSSAGTILTTDLNRGLGWMTSSNDATHLVMPSYSGGTVDLLEFDNVNGTLSNPIVLTGITKPYGTAFSPNDQILYVTADMSLLQFDLSSGDSATITNSMYNVITEGNMMRAMRPGPDGKIFVAREWDVYLGLIYNPNVIGSLCAYTSMGIYLSPNSNALGLPNNYSLASNPCPVSIIKSEFISELKIYPQPAGSTLNIEFSLLSQSILSSILLDISGKPILSQEYNSGSGFNRLCISLESVPRGIYLLQISDGENFIRQKIVKE